MSKLPQSDHDLQCMEIIGGNRAVRQTVAAPGLDIRIDSRPLGQASARDGQASGGGDVHYVSTCGAGHVTRLALADISGHGTEMDRLAVDLRKLMRKYINTLDQTRFAQALNEELTEIGQSGRFTTAILLTYFSPTRHLIICNAGHVRPLWYSAAQGKWHFLDLKCAGDCPSLKTSKVRYHFERLANLPLGVLAPMEYEQFAVSFASGDVLLLCTDAITEAENEHGERLGEAGLLALVNALPRDGVGRFAEGLLAAVDLWRGKKPCEDDQTVIVLTQSETPIPSLSLLHTFRTLGKIIGLIPV